jgi:mannan endo-1,4-beta-mannosidase
LADIQGLGRHRQASPEKLRTPVRRHRASIIITIAAAAIAAAAVVVTSAVYVADRPRQATPVTLKDGHVPLPTTPDSYIGVYPDGVPNSYGGVAAFRTATGVKPSIVLYYSGWLQSFETSFAMTVSNNGAVPLVQLDPKNVSIASIASGQYDGYLSAYAKAVRAYRRPVILSFCHEMNGYWYSWGYQHTPAAVFVAAWRHIVTLFRTLGARNVTWMWTINTIHKRANVPSPRPWWPGSSYVNWVGIDGYYFDSSSVFASLFGPTIAAVRALTHEPILIAETSAAPAAGQPAKIADLFAGIRLYGLLGFVWFDTSQVEDWRLTSPAAISAFRRGFANYSRRRHE